MDPERAARVRENKRRFRSRRKEYVADLERSLKELREQGIQATKEVQLSAQKVARENEQLRGLLRHHGVGDGIIDSWIQRANLVDETAPYTKGPQKWGAQDKCSEAVCPSLSSQSLLTRRQDGEQRDDTTKEEPPPLQPAPRRLDDTKGQSAGQYLPSTGCLESSSRRSQGRVSEGACLRETTKASSSSQLPPCKLVSRLAANPSADITKIRVADSQTEQAQEVDGLECSKAYQMLMQFATTDDKLDTAALALEKGCVATGGGCKVLNKVVFKALDDLQR
ncbi:MAG: hypothetical protein M1829_001813 [Trizodia sp. TS-e1964]|nr:MAG: hypothetical protein M1829_001813 [Trizodia sp. TS-e1964]